MKPVCEASSGRWKDVGCTSSDVFVLRTLSLGGLTTPLGESEALDPSSGMDGEICRLSITASFQVRELVLAENEGRRI